MNIVIEYLNSAIRTWSPWDDGPSRHELRELRRQILLRREGFHVMLAAKTFSRTTGG